ncbi:MAG: 16S rRNA (cytidine(1402)-2'-O)-methyltransferase [Nitrospinae bacterium]|nr:16S rRNA (cytidine(1402)-2'-O)-methyltransferase [Nitrospinota bacterium]
MVGTPLGNLADFTPRAVEALSTANIVACEDTRHSRVLFDHYDLRPASVVSYHAHNLDRMTPKLVEAMAGGETVALISDAGTPGISDPGAPLVKAALEAGIVVVPIPGPTAPILAVTASGFPSHRFVYEGFIPRKKGRQTMMESWREEKRTVIFLESPQRIVKTLKEMADRIGPRQVCVARELTKKFEEFLRGDLAAVAATLEVRGSVKGEITVVLAPAKWKGEAREEEEEDERL